MSRTSSRGVRAALFCFSLAAMLVIASGPLQAQSAAYRNFDDFSAALRALTDSSPNASLRSIGTSHEGRDVWMVEVAAPGGPAIAERPALLIVGNLEGDHLIGSELALETVRYLIGDESAQSVLASQVVYVVPRLNPDGAEAMFGAVRQPRRGNAAPYDDDNDGRIDEDPAEDLNGDGVVTMMRVMDPEGTYIVDPDDARLMKVADASKGESGRYSVYWEGRDSDGDGFYNEDGAGGADLNRNFQHEYPYWEADAGVHMVSEPESRALMDFMVAHRNIGAILTYGHSDNLVNDVDGQGNQAGINSLQLAAYADASNSGVHDVGVFQGNQGFGGGFGFFFGGGGGPRLRGAQLGQNNDPNSGQRPATSVSGDDRPYFNAVAEAYREITGIERIGLSRDAAGAFYEFGYYQFGVPSFSTTGWGLAAAAAGDEDSEGDSDAEGAADGAAAAMAANTGGRAGGQRPRGGGGGRGGGASGGGGGGASADAALLAHFETSGTNGFVEWTPFEHDQLGQVEIGGFDPYAAVNPDAAQIADLGAKHGEFTVRLAGMLPRVAIVDTEVTSHGGGVFTISVEVENSGYFPTALQHGVRSRAVQPTTVQLQVDPDDVLTGAAKSSTVARLDGSGGRERFTWVIRGSAGSSVEISLRSQKGGSDSATVTLR